MSIGQCTLDTLFNNHPLPKNLTHDRGLRTQDPTTGDHKIVFIPDEATVKLEYHLKDLQSEIQLFDGVFNSLPHQLCDANIAQPGIL